MIITTSFWDGAKRDQCWNFIDTWNDNTFNFINFHFLTLFQEGKPTNFVFGEESKEAKRRILLELEKSVKQQMDKMSVIMEEGIERELKKQKEAQIKANI